MSNLHTDGVTINIASFHDRIAKGDYDPPVEGAGLSATGKNVLLIRNHLEQSKKRIPMTEDDG